MYTGQNEKRTMIGIETRNPRPRVVRLSHYRVVRGCHLGMVFSQFWCNFKHKSIGICIERVQGMKRNGGGVTMPEGKPTPCLLHS